MTVERVIPFRLMPATPGDNSASIDARLSLLVRLVEDMSGEIRRLTQESSQLAKTLLGSSLPASFPSTGAVAEERGLCVGVLGELTVTWNGEAVDIPLGRKARMLLAFLATSRPTPREKNELLGVFWPDCVDSRASNNLSIAVHQLRSWLGGLSNDARSIILVRQSRYSLQGACWTDVEEFRSAIVRGHRASAGGDTSEASQAYLAAIALYKGEFLASEPCEEWALSLRRELSTQYIEAAKWLAREAVQSRAWGVAIDHAERIRAEDDLDEDAYQLLMLAHWRSGSRPRAILAYQECEARLGEALGLGPSVLTQKLYNDVRGMQGGN